MKNALRKTMREKRRDVSLPEREMYSRAICDELRRRFALRRVTVAAYLAACDEISLDGFIASPPPGVRLVAPRWDSAAKAYALAEITSHPSSLPCKRFGIREPGDDAKEVAPRDVDVWLVPGLAFTRDGARLGYGGGFYDRFLSAASPSAISIAIAYPFQILPSLPSEPHDRKVSEILALPLSAAGDA